jgi:small membrane protein
MIFQVLLVVALCILVVYAYFQRRNAPLIALSVFILTLCGLVFAVAPNISNDLAHFVGIGRGADLIVYCFILISLAAIFNLHLRFRLNEERLTQLVRAFALLTAQKPEASLADSEESE